MQTWLKWFSIPIFFLFKWKKYQWIRNWIWISAIFAFRMSKVLPFWIIIWIIISPKSYKCQSLEKKILKKSVTSNHYQMWHTGSRLFEPFTWLVSAPTVPMLVTVIFINGKKWLTMQEKFTMLSAIKKCLWQGSKFIFSQSHQPGK